ncbi:MAG: hypothetical protein KG075_09425 [Alphaproteobacteria bacterium]|nr:hypothetical protein [Alphaproteobacteria bacterium]
MSDTTRSEGDCDDAEIMRLWREAGLPEYFLGNGGSNVDLVKFAELIRASSVQAEPTDDDRANNDPHGVLECLHKDCGRFQDRAGWSCSAISDNACARKHARAARMPAPVPNWTQMARAMQRIGAVGTEDEIESILCNAASPRATGETGNG